MYQYLRTLALRQLTELADHIRLVIVHPNYAQQHLILSEFINEDTVYVRFTGKKLNLNTLKQQFETTFAEQLGTRPQESINTIVLDEFDRGQQKALDSFIKHILKLIPNARFVLFSRSLPQSIITDATLREQTDFIPKDQHTMLYDYTDFESKEDEVLLEIQGFGDGQAYLNGQQIVKWDGALPRALFFYLADRGMTTRDEIFKTFWAKLSSSEATNVFHVTKRKINEVLGIELTKYWSGYYRLAPNITIRYDVMLFNDLLQQSAIAEPEQAVILLTKAVSLYRGLFLNTINMEWVTERRMEIQEEYAEALAALAKVKEALGEKQEALGLYLRALSYLRQREDITASVMNLYRDYAMHADALRIYEQLTQELQKKLGVHPAPHLQTLMRQIQKEMR